LCVVAAVLVIVIIGKVGPAGAQGGNNYAKAFYVFACIIILLFVVGLLTWMQGSVVGPVYSEEHKVNAYYFDQSMNGFGIAFLVLAFAAGLAGVYVLRKGGAHGSVFLTRLLTVYMFILAFTQAINLIRLSFDDVSGGGNSWRTKDAQGKERTMYLSRPKMDLETELILSGVGLGFGGVFVIVGSTTFAQVPDVPEQEQTQVLYDGHGSETRPRRMTNGVLQGLFSELRARRVDNLDIGGAQGIHDAFLAMMRGVGSDLLMALRRANGQQLWPDNIDVVYGMSGFYPVHWDVFYSQCRKWLGDYEAVYEQRGEEEHGEEFLVPSRSPEELEEILNVIRSKVSLLELEPLRYELLLEVMVFMDKLDYAPLNSAFVTKFIMDASSGYVYRPGPSTPMLPAVLDTDGTEIFPTVSADTFSCTLGIYDRIITSFIDAVNVVCCSRSDCDVPLLSGLCAILRLSDLKVDRINTYLRQWIAVPDSSYASLTPEQRKDNMINFIVAKAASGVQERDVLARIRDYVVRLIYLTPALSDLKFECIDKEEMIVDPEACETEAAGAGAGEAAGAGAGAGAGEAAGAGAGAGAGEAAGAGAGAGAGEAAGAGAGEAAGAGAGQAAAGNTTFQSPLAIIGRYPTVLQELGARSAEMDVTGNAEEVFRRADRIFGGNRFVEQATPDSVAQAAGISIPNVLSMPMLKWKWLFVTIFSPLS
jgi:hypothetical protein